MVITFFSVDFVLHSKLEELEKTNQDLQAEIQRLKQETENLRLSKGKSLNIWIESGKISWYLFWYVCVVLCVPGVKHQDSQNSFLAFLNAPTSALDQFDVGILKQWHVASF